MSVVRQQVKQSLTLTTDNGKTVLVRKPKYTLADLISQCDLSARPPADLDLWDTARLEGNEVLD